MKCICGYEIGEEKRAKTYVFQTSIEATKGESANWMGSLAIITLIAGVILLGIGLLTEPGISAFSEDVVNLHKIHIKQTLYYFSGVCFLISAITYGFDKLLTVLMEVKNKSVTEVEKAQEETRSTPKF
jgi:hypothetical protein